jgi:small-conductance mechanosensitive channel
MKWKEWLVAIALLALLAAGGVAYFVTRDDGTSTLARRRRPPLVDQSALDTARALSQRALTPEERHFARQAVRVADHTVDLAFADALIQATEQQPEQDPKFRDLYARRQRIQTRLADQEAQLKRLNALATGAKPTEKDALQTQIAILQAQHELDQDELDDARQDLFRAGGDPEGRIKRLQAQHEAAEHSAETQSANTTSPPVSLTSENLYEQLQAWRWLRTTEQLVEAAQEAALASSKNREAEHDALERQVAAEKPLRDATRQKASNAAALTGTAPEKQEAANDTIKSFKEFSNHRRLLADYEKRSQDQQDLADAYGRWLIFVNGQQRTVLHRMVGSALWILLVLLVTYLVGRAIDRFVAGIAPEKRRLVTLRTVARFGIQTLAVLLIAFIVFGMPSQMTTVIGLAGAGLTVALKDFIVAFFGWFVLMGRNGIRVGDWVEINGVVGEVVEISLWRTVLLETGNWTDTGHPTGRKVAFVNSFAIEGHFFNFSTAGQWMWDEIELMIPSGQNPYQMMEAVQQVVEQQTRADAAVAGKEWERSVSNYKVKALSPSPAIQLKPTPSGVEMKVRYVTSAHERFATRARMYEQIVALLHGGPAAHAAGSASPHA